MADLCSIGPISITPAQRWDDNSFSVASGSSVSIACNSSIFTKGQYTSSESFSILCSNDEAIQLKGIVEIGEPVWIDSSTDLTDNNYLQHKGWYLIVSIDYDYINPVLVQCDLEILQISTHASEYLTQDYSRGVYDGIRLDTTYAPTTTTYMLQDDMSTFSATNWDTTIYEWSQNNGNPTTSCVSDGAELDFAIASNTDGKQCTAHVNSKTKYKFPFTLETVLDRNSLPGAGSYLAAMGIAISPNLAVNKVANPSDVFLIQWALTSSYAKLIAMSSMQGAKGWTTHYPLTDYGTANANMGIKLEFEANGTVTFYTDYGLTGSYTQRYRGPCNIKNYQNGVYIILRTFNQDSTSFTGSFHFMDIYNDDAVVSDYVVAMPYNATLQTAATGTRTGEDGNISYYKNPTTALRYQIAQADMYKGSVKLISTNNAASASNQVYNTDHRLTPATTTLKNAFTRLTFDADEMIMEGYFSGGWQAINRFDFGTSISIMKPLYISHDEVVLQINDTKIRMTRSSPMITFYHPNTSVTYTLRDRYYHDGALTSSPGAAADITMEDTAVGYYATAYDNASDTYQLLIGKKDPCTIKSDSLPADDITGIGWWEKNMTGDNDKDDMVRQWWKQTKTRTSMKQIV